ncbi:O-methyltransferase [Aidingimonas lacisalsi]|uniref:O-methyltransferase n=1 Tax=Aidingimonas lacisalsi TaxID=2604086 RepID=UPI0011D25353|nr:O-methyltransferase [Aidingimonas lacisalsi]
MELELILEELERLGQDNDALATQRERKYLNITRDTGQFLAVLVKASAAKSVLEIGTSNGYSTLWLASALPDDGHVTTVEVSPQKIEEATSNFEKAKLGHQITIVKTDASSYLKQSDQRFDLVFLDADRSQYADVAQEIVALVRPGGLLICDNAVSHASELEAFMHAVAGTEEFTTALVPVGKGEFVACKRAPMPTNSD